jgi:hypothetical protein
MHLSADLWVMRVISDERRYVLSPMHVLYDPTTWERRTVDEVKELLKDLRVSLDTWFAAFTLGVVACHLRPGAQPPGSDQRGEGGLRRAERCGPHRHDEGDEGGEGSVSQATDGQADDNAEDTGRTIGDASSDAASDLPPAAGSTEQAPEPNAHPGL